MEETNCQSFWRAEVSRARLSDPAQAIYPRVTASFPVQVSSCPVEAASAQHRHRSRREVLLRTSSQLRTSNSRQPRARVRALRYQVTVTSFHLPFKIPQISRRIGEQPVRHHRQIRAAHQIMVCLCMTPLQKLDWPRDSNAFVLLLTETLLQPFPGKVADRHLIRVHSSRRSEERITELHSLSFAPPFNFFTLGNTKKSRRPRLSASHTCEHAAQEQHVTHSDLLSPDWLCLNFKSSSNNSCSFSISRYSDSGH